MFNSFLPILLESRVDPSCVACPFSFPLTCFANPSPSSPSSLQLGAYLIETPHLNRRITLVIFTVLTALATLLFSAVRTKAGVISSSMAISFAGSCMYSVLYSMTPEVRPCAPQIRIKSEDIADRRLRSPSVRSSPQRSEEQLQEQQLRSLACTSTSTLPPFSLSLCFLPNPT